MWFSEPNLRNSVKGKCVLRSLSSVTVCHSRLRISLEINNKWTEGFAYLPLGCHALKLCLLVEGLGGETD